MDSIPLSESSDETSSTTTTLSSVIPVLSAWTIESKQSRRSSPEFLLTKMMLSEGYIRSGHESKLPRVPRAWLLAPAALQTPQHCLSAFTGFAICSNFEDH